MDRESQYVVSDLLEAIEKLTEVVRELNPGATRKFDFIDFVLARVGRTLQEARDRSDRE